MTAFWLILRRELRLAFRQPGDTLLVLAFFVLGTVFFPLAVGPDSALLERIAPGLVWVMALFATLLGFDRMFAADHEDGSLDQLILSTGPLSLLVLAKAAAHWLVTAVPLIIVTPAISAMLKLGDGGLWVLLTTLLLGTPTLTLIGTIGAALTLGARRGGVLLALLLLPLFVPVLIFGATAVDAALHGESAKPHIMLLGAMLLGALALTPWGAAAALRQAAE